METGPKVYEKTLYEVWKSKSFEKELFTVEGLDVAILDVGLENTDTSGPDFKNARIRIGNLIYVGDVEIDNDFSDWKSHGHSINKKYNKVILHLSLTNRSRHAFVYNKEGRKIPTVCISDFVNTSSLISERSFDKPQDGEYNQTRLKCIDSNSTVDAKIKTSFVYDLGISRFRKKCDKYFQRLKEIAYLKSINIKEPVIGYDHSKDFLAKEFCFEDFKDKAIWQQLFYEYLFEALGYSKNKNIMLSLAQAVNVDVLRKLVHAPYEVEKINSVLFNVAGLMPGEKLFQEREIAEYVENLSSYWDANKSIYDGKLFSDTHWYFFKLRPQNFPTIRLAGGAIILQKLMYEDFMGLLIRKFNDIQNINTLIRAIKTLFVIRGEGFWKTHYVFDKKSSEEILYFIGGSRADEIIINVVLPFISLYAEIFGNKNLSQKALSVYGAYNQKDDNTIVKYISDSLGMDSAWKRSILSQGMLELFRNYCSKGKCLECEIGKAAFE